MSAVAEMLGLDMGHYDINQWADYVRGLGESAGRAAMDRHLAGGCPTCAKTADLLRRVAEAGAEDDRRQPPGWAVTVVRFRAWKLMTSRRRGLLRMNPVASPR